MPSKPPSRVAAVLKIAFGTLLCFVEFSGKAHGLVPPVNGETIGFDAWGVAVYLFCLWAIVTGIRTLAAKDAGAA